MGPSLPLLFTLLLRFTLTARAFDQLEYCQAPRICPQFTRVSANEKYEERVYEPTAWMCTVEDGTDTIAVTRAAIRLMTFMSQQSWAQVIEISEETWPSLISVEQLKREREFSLCWFVPPGVTLSSSGPVTVETFPRTTMFVRTFGGVPSFESGRENYKKLLHDLLAAGERFDPTVFYGAGYRKYISRIHHNEIWIPKA